MIRKGDGSNKRVGNKQEIDRKARKLNTRSFVAFPIQKTCHNTNFDWVVLELHTHTHIHTPTRSTITNTDTYTNTNTIENYI